MMHVFFGRFARAAACAALVAAVPFAAFAGDPAAAAADAKAAATAAGMDEKQTISYIIGTQVGDNLKRNQIDVDFDVFLKGLRAAVEGTEQPFTPQQKGAIMNEFQTKMQEKMRAEQDKVANANLEAAEKFLAENKGKEGVVTTESGLQYKVEKAGEGANPTDANTVKVHYTGTLLDGTKFDSSVDRGEPAEFGVTQVIAGWTEALKLMKPGAKYKLWIHPEKAYGRNSPPSIPANSLLVFDVELLEIK